MKNFILPALIALLLLGVAPACKKNKNGGGCGETELKVTTTPATGTVDPPAPGTSFPLVVNIDEGIPSAGVTIEVKARQDQSNSTPYFTETRDNVTMSNNHFTITNTPTGVTCLVEIAVTSKSCNTNKWTGSYRYSAK